MNIKELYKSLQELGILEERYYLHGLYGSTDDENRLALMMKGEKGITHYEVYYKEKGEKHSFRTFNSEFEACQYFLELIQNNMDIEAKYVN